MEMAWWCGAGLGRLLPITQRDLLRLLLAISSTSLPMASVPCRVTPRDWSLTTVGASQPTSVFFNSVRTLRSRMCPRTSVRGWRRLPNDAAGFRQCAVRAVAAKRTAIRRRGSVGRHCRTFARSPAGAAFLPVRLSLLDGNGTRFDGHSAAASHSGRQVGNVDPPDVRGRLPDASVHGDPSDPSVAEYTDPLPLGKARRGTQCEYSGQGRVS